MQKSMMKDFLRDAMKRKLGKVGRHGREDQLMRGGMMRGYRNGRCIMKVVIVKRHEEGHRGRNIFKQ